MLNNEHKRNIYINFKSLKIELTKADMTQTDLIQMGISSKYLFDMREGRPISRYLLGRITGMIGCKGEDIIQ